MAARRAYIGTIFFRLYAHTDVEIEPQSAGRQMGGHYEQEILMQMEIGKI